MNPAKEGIRLNLVELFKKTKKKQSDLAKACGVGKSAVSNWLSGKSSIDIERIPAICEFFNITIDEFFGQSQKLEPAMTLTDYERALVLVFRSCETDAHREAILNIARIISGL